MEHIVQFAIGIDDEAIVKTVKETAESTIIKNLQQQVRDNLFQTGYFPGSNADEKSALNEYSKRLICDFLEKHKDEILEKTAVYLSEKLVRTKAAKELLAKG